MLSLNDIITYIRNKYNNQFLINYDCSYSNANIDVILHLHIIHLIDKSCKLSNDNVNYSTEIVLISKDVKYRKSKDEVESDIINYLDNILVEHRNSKIKSILNV